jgi:hypothetical protein
MAYPNFKKLEKWPQEL